MQEPTIKTNNIPVPEQEVYIGNIDPEDIYAVSDKGHYIWSPCTAMLRSIQEGSISGESLKDFLKKITLVSMNLDEARRVMGFLGYDTNLNANELARALVNELKAKVVCITDGPNPVTYFSSYMDDPCQSKPDLDEKTLELMASKLFGEIVVDGNLTNGCGDTFLGALYAMLESGSTIEVSVAVADALARLKRKVPYSNLASANPIVLAYLIEELVGRFT